MFSVDVVNGSWVKKEQCPHPDGQVRARVGAQKKGKLSGLGFWPDSEASCDVHASVMDETNVKRLSNTLHVKKCRESVQEWPWNVVNWNENSRTIWNRTRTRKWQLCARNHDRLHRSDDKKKEKSVRGAMNLLKWNAWKAPLSMPVESQLSDQRCCFSTISRYRNEAMMKLKSTMMISGWRYGDSVLILSQDTHSHMPGSISSVVDCLEIRSLPLETRKKGLLKLMSLSTCFN